MYRGNHGNEQSEALKQDALISALKKDLFELREKEHHLVTVADQTHQLEAKLAMQQEEKERKEK